jgi:hypothetical protein
MQAVISVPELAGRLSEQHATEMLMRPIAGWIVVTGKEGNRLLQMRWAATNCARVCF